MEIIFDFLEEPSNIFGKILRPVAEITLIHENIEIPETAYVDSGADITILPKSLGEVLGLVLQPTDKVIKIKGISQNQVPMVIKHIKLRIGEKIIQAKVAWALIEEVPLLLGRTDVFEFFDITFKKNTKTIFSE